MAGQGAIAPGTLWEAEIEAASEQSVFFIPIVTPTVVRSSYCRFELDAFLARERALGRSDLIFPILYIRVPGLEDSAVWEADPVLSTIARRQFVDWREFRHLDVYSTPVGKAIERLCSKIAEALERPYASEAEREKRRQEEAERLRQEEARRAAEEEERRRAQEEEERRLRTEAERALRSSVESSSKRLDRTVEAVDEANADGTGQFSEEPAATAPEAMCPAGEAEKDGSATDLEAAGALPSTEKDAKGKPEKKTGPTVFPGIAWLIPTLVVALVAGVVIFQTYNETGPPSEPPFVTWAPNVFGQSAVTVGEAFAKGYAADTAKEYAEAMRWYRKAADQGYAAAQYNIARMYERGEGVKPDLAQARVWMQKAADAGDNDAKKWVASH